MKFTNSPRLHPCPPGCRQGEVGAGVHRDAVRLEVLVDDGRPHDPYAGDEEEAGGTVEVVHPARHRVLPGGEDDARPHDTHRQLPGLAHDQLLGQGLGEGVGVGSLTYQHLCEARTVQDLGVQALQQRQGLVGLHGRRVGLLLYVRPLTVAVGRGDVDQRLQLLHLLAEGDDEGDGADVHGEGLAQLLVEPHGGSAVEHDLSLR